MIWAGLAMRVAAARGGSRLAQVQDRDLSMTERRSILTENFGPTRKEQIDAAVSVFQEKEWQRKQEARAKADERPVTEAEAQDEAARFFAGLEGGRATVG